MNFVKKHPYVCGTLTIIFIGVFSLYCFLFSPFKKIPSYLQDIPSKIFKNEELIKAFQEKYPEGTSETILIEDLKRQNFEITKHGAAFYKPRFPCTTHIYIHWQKDDKGKVTFIEGGKSDACP